MGGLTSDPLLLAGMLIEAVSQAIAKCAPLKIVEKLAAALADLVHDPRKGVKAAHSALRAYHRWLKVH
jgi:hypothetical protein